MIRPIGIQHANFRHGGVSVFSVAEIALGKEQILHAHRQAQFGMQGFNLRFALFIKACQHRHRLRHRHLHFQGCRLVHLCQARFDGVDAIALYRSLLRLAQRTLQRIDLGGTDQGCLALRQNLYALGRAVCPLVILAGQIFHPKDKPAIHLRQRFLIHRILVGFGKNGIPCLEIRLLVYALHIVAHKNAHLLQIQVQMIGQVAF